MVGRRHRPELILARQTQKVIAMFARLASPQAPRRAFLAARLLEVPLPFHQIAYTHVDAEPTAVFSGAAGIGAQCTTLDQNRALEFDAFDRAIAHVALTHRDRARLAVFVRTPAPAAALQALHDERAVRFRMLTEKDNGSDEAAVMPGWRFVGH